MGAQMKQLPWSVQMDQKAKELIEDPEKYFREARERNSRSVGEEKISLRKLFSK